VGEVQKELGSVHALVVHGSDGLDEITTTGPTRVAEVKDGELKIYSITPADLGLDTARPEDLLGGEPEENAATFTRLLDGEAGPLADIVAANAGAALYVAGKADSLKAGTAAAREALGSGAARRQLDQLRAFGR
jgi:anthranilate phosphoribosyltransferase